MEGYDVAQICLNGHLINDCSKAYPQHNSNFCTKCSAETITQCPNCNEPIKGYYHSEFGGFTDFTRPSYCDNCGSPYPWTISELEAARLLISEDEQLTDDEKNIFSESLPDLIADTPKTQLAVARFTKYSKKCVDITATALRDIIVDIGSEAVKKVLFQMP